LLRSHFCFHKRKKKTQISGIVTQTSVLVFLALAVSLSLSLEWHFDISVTSGEKELKRKNFSFLAFYQYGKQFSTKTFLVTTPLQLFLAFTL
jgi:hypothetical protein